MTETHDHHAWTHGHFFLGHGHGKAEARAKLAALVTGIFMLVEIGCGFAYRSMALIADGIHMATHVGALGLAALAYWLARRHAANTRFTFGSGKFGDLAAFASALLLGVAGIAVAVESFMRLLAPVPVRYSEALLIAALGLGVNLVSALILKGGHEHDHHHGDHHDHNMRAAYLHVLADAGTSALAVMALATGAWFGAGFFDPLVGIIGAGVIASWAYGLIKDSAMVLLDAEDNPALAREIRTMIEEELKARVADLHLWRLGPGHSGLIVSLICADQISADSVRAALRSRYGNLSHVTVEIAVCADCA
ncbi:MAG TPA: CDF family Co(II)/Ni(II) efflux transporter DmeF [Rhizomicrobium sp.]